MHLKNLASLLFTSYLLFAHTLSASPSYVGDIVCKECHSKEYANWKGSHHDLAMQQANKKSVLGDFNNIEFKLNGIISTFYKDKKQFMVKTEGVDGKLQDFEISYTFGVYPLQQYMVKFPKGKVQVLDIAWDSRKKDKGGQRWFSLHPDENIKAGDVLHWTGPNLNWNYMCADCHSTNLKKNYDAKDKSYNTQWSSINVSCEACHGPASAHIDWAKLKNSKTDNGLSIHFTEKLNNSWHINTKTGKPELTQVNQVKTNKKEIEVCAKCHSRRSQISDDFVPGQNFRDHYLPALLTPQLYYPDGKIKDEVYVYGSFQQSKMYAQGVRCSDCHNPHTLELKLPGDKVCSQCHQANKYNSIKHHLHKTDSEGASCISCHMPPKTYMGVDVRNDHSFRIPRPDIASSLNIPDACSNCHKDKDSLWASMAIKNGYGKIPKGYQQFAKTINALEKQQSNPLQLTYDLLKADAPQIAKASVVAYMGGYASKQTLLTSMQMLRSKDADTRRQALYALESFPLQHTLAEIYKTLKDPVKIVRIEAARILSSLPSGNLNVEQKTLIDRVTKEYHNSLLFIAERPEAQLSMAQLYQNRPELGDAETAYKEAIVLQPNYIPAYINYADFLKQKNEQMAYKILQEGLKQQQDASLFHALGLWYIRDKKKVEGIRLLKKAAKLAPDNIRYQYVYAVAIGSNNPNKAIEILKKVLEKHKASLVLLTAIVSYYNQLQDKENEKNYRKKIQDVMKVLP